MLSGALNRKRPWQSNCPPDRSVLIAESVWAAPPVGIGEACVRLGVPGEVGHSASSEGWVALALGPDSLAVATTHPLVAHHVGPALWVPGEIDGDDNWIVPTSSTSELTRALRFLPRSAGDLRRQ